MSTYPRTLEAAGTGCLSGTSMAAAYVSGSLASLVSSGLDNRTALAHLLATASRSVDDPAPVANLGAALDRTPAASGEDLARAVTKARRAVAAAEVEATPDRGTLASLVGEWPVLHPIRTRAIGVAAMALGVFVLLRRPRSRALGF
jgi:hypothetical protein